MSKFSNIFLEEPFNRFGEGECATVDLSCGDGALENVPSLTVSASNTRSQAAVSEQPVRHLPLAGGG